MTPPQKTVASETSYNDSGRLPPLEHRPFLDPSRLAPEDAFFAHSPPRWQQERTVNGTTDTHTLKSDVARAGLGTRRRRDKDRGRSGSRRRKGAWKKILWIKQSCKSTPFPQAITAILQNLTDSMQTQIIIPTLLRSYHNFNETPVCSLTTSGPWSPILQL